MLTAIEVGKPYPASYSDGVQFAAFMPGGSLLRVAMPGITKPEQKDYRKGTPRFAIVRQGTAILTLWRFGSQPWVDAPFDADIAKRNGQLELVDIGESTRLTIQLHLIDSQTGITKGIRLFTLSTRGTQQLTSAIQDQLATPPAAQDFDAMLSVPTDVHVQRLGLPA